MSFPIIINSTNKVRNNTYNVQLATSTDLNDYEVGISQAFIYYSWYNIYSSGPYQNNKFYFGWPYGTSSVSSYIFSLPEGRYQISDINTAFQQFMIDNGLYLLNNTTQEKTFYAEISVSATSYSCTITTRPIPNILPSGYSFPSGLGLPFNANQQPFFQFNAGYSNFNLLLGINNGSYPLGITTNANVFTKSSDFIPNIDPVGSIQIHLSCIYNLFSSNTQLLHVFTNEDSALGQIIDASPIETNYIPCTGTHRELQLTFYDQNGNILNLIDPNLIIKLVFRKI
tara:strand:- start:1117 stop:1968 length:852 start_codon:yes stop_codon:yes gene_type:complete